ncbi:MAG: dihydroorotase [Pseudomonadota bacterium]
MIEDEKLECQYIKEDFSYEAEVKRKGVLSALCLEEENARFADSPGISINNRDQGFRPAFQDMRTGFCMISQFADGRPAPIHILDGLPEEWIEVRESNGQAIRACPQIISGFVRNGCFYTRDEASQVILNQGDALI